MSQASSPTQGRRVLIIGSQGVLGSLLVDAFTATGWAVLRGGRRPDERPDFRALDLNEPETVAAAIADTDLVINTVPDSGLTAERMVLDQGGLLINDRPCPTRPAVASAGTLRQRQESWSWADIAPGLTNLVAADLLAAHPDADEIEFALPSRSNPRAVPQGETSPPQPGRCPGATAQRSSRYPNRSASAAASASPQQMPAGSAASQSIDRTVSPYVCIAERATHRAMLALNKAGLLSRLPRAAFGSRATSPNRGDASQEPIAHWIAVLKEGTHRRRTLECRGDYHCAAQSTVIFAHNSLTTPPPPSNPASLIRGSAHLRTNRPDSS